MNVQTRFAPAGGVSAKLKLVDCDLHPIMTGKEMERRYLAREWHDYSENYGGFERHALSSLNPWPGIEPNIARRDSYPTGGGLPGSDLAFMQMQHLDPYNIGIGILLPIKPHVGQRNIAYAAALASAMNEWQLGEWTTKDSRLRASLVVPYDNAEAAVAEIRRLGDNTQFGSILLLTQSNLPLGARQYWPIYRAAEEFDLPISIHTGTPGGGPLMGGAGWPSYHIQKQQLPHMGMESTLSSMVLDGVFEEFPRLRVMLVEGGFSWMPMAAWRMDKVWERSRNELSNVKRPPSEYIRENVWSSSQPMDVFDDPQSLKNTIEWLGWDRLCFASDYPHWDFDDPQHIFPFQLTAEQERMFYAENAMAALRI